MMRFFRASGVLFLWLLMSCGEKINPNKSSATPADASTAKQVTGSWELRSVYGGNRLNNGNDERAPGNGDVYTFAGSHFEHYAGHELLDSGTCTISKSRGPENGDPLYAFAFNNTDTVLFVLSGDTLTLNPRAPMYDGVARKYVRVYVR